MLLHFFDTAVVGSLIPLAKFDEVLPTIQDPPQGQGVPFRFPSLYDGQRGLLYIDPHDPNQNGKFMKHHANMEEFTEAWKAFLESPQTRGIAVKPQKRWVLVKRASRGSGEGDSQRTKLASEEPPENDTVLEEWQQEVMREFESSKLGAQ